MKNLTDEQIIKLIEAECEALCVALRERLDSLVELITEQILAAGNRAAERCRELEAQLVKKIVSLEHLVHKHKQDLNTAWDRIEILEEQKRK